jgi:F0F1-type ATP synthase assembly protein I
VKADRPPDAKELGYYLTIAQVGLEMVAMIGIGLLLDHYLGWSPWGLIGGTVFGFVGGLSHLIVLANRQEQRRRPPPGEGRDS